MRLFFSGIDPRAVQVCDAGEREVQPQSLAKACSLLQCRSPRMRVSLNEEVGTGVASEVDCLGLDPGKGDFDQGSPPRSAVPVHAPDGSKAGGSGWAGSAELIPARCTVSIISYSLWLSSYFTGSFNLIVLEFKSPFLPY